jgi:hypothetical protein
MKLDGGLAQRLPLKSTACEVLVYAIPICQIERKGAKDLLDLPGWKRIGNSFGIRPSETHKPPSQEKRSSGPHCPGNLKCKSCTAK